MSLRDHGVHARQPDRPASRSAISSTAYWRDVADPRTRPAARAERIGGATAPRAAPAERAAGRSAARAAARCAAHAPLPALRAGRELRAVCAAVEGHRVVDRSKEGVPRLAPRGAQRAEDAVGAQHKAGEQRAVGHSAGGGAIQSTSCVDGCASSMLSAAWWRCASTLAALGGMASTSLASKRGTPAAAALAKADGGAAAGADTSGGCTSTAAGGPAARLRRCGSGVGGGAGGGAGAAAAAARIALARCSLA